MHIVEKYQIQKLYSPQNSRKMGYNPREHICELFDFKCMRKNDRNVYM